MARVSKSEFGVKVVAVAITRSKPMAVVVKTTISL